MPEPVAPDEEPVEVPDVPEPEAPDEAPELPEEAPELPEEAPELPRIPSAHPGGESLTPPPDLPVPVHRLERDYRLRRLFERHRRPARH